MEYYIQHRIVRLSWQTVQGGPKTGYQYYLGDNFGNSAPILTILSLLQAEIYGV